MTTPDIATRMGLPRFNASAIAPGKESDMITVGIVNEGDEAALVSLIQQIRFAAVYERQTARGKPHSVALFCVARKLVEVMCGMYKTDMPFSLQTAGATTCQ